MMERYETMKTMTCAQLGGPSNEALAAESLEKIAEMSKAHVTQMFQRGDAAHLLAAEKMKNWFESKRKEFEALAQD